MKPRYINARDLPAEYGIAEKTVIHIVHRRLLPYYRPLNGTVLFERTVIENFIRAGRVESFAAEVHRRTAWHGRTA